jgi:hypothetical protein
MKVFEVVTKENLLLKGLGAVKSLATKALPKATTAAPAADDAAIRAAQDARLMALSKKGFDLIPKIGNRVRLDIANASKDPRFSPFVHKSKGMNLNNYVDGKVVDIVDSGPRGKILKVKLDLTGEIASWPAERFIANLR